MGGLDVDGDVGLDVGGDVVGDIVGGLVCPSYVGLEGGS